MGPPIAMNVWRGDTEIAYDGECDTVCNEIYQPVCGVDGVTYGNSCEAEGVEVAEGQCDDGYDSSVGSRTIRGLAGLGCVH